MKTISILIPIHNRLKITQQGLLYIREEIRNYKDSSNRCAFEIVVIDDGSTDGSGDWIREHCPEVRVLTGDGNLWWSGAMNVGAEYAIKTLKSDFLLLWNDDVTPANGYFSRIEEIALDPIFKDVIVGSKIMDYQNPETVWSTGGAFNRLTGEMTMIEKLKDSKTSYSNCIECDWIAGMGTLIPITIVADSNLWWDDKKFPQYYGDSDFILRAKKKGFKVLTNLSLVIYNKTEFSGVKNKSNLKELLAGLKSLRSLYNVHIDLLFYTRHAYFPFAFYGIFKKYFFYIGGYFKNSVLKLSKSDSSL